MNERETRRLEAQNPAIRVHGLQKILTGRENLIMIAKLRQVETPTG